MLWNFSCQQTLKLQHCPLWKQRPLPLNLFIWSDAFRPIRIEHSAVGDMKYVEQLNGFARWCWNSVHLADFAYASRQRCGSVLLVRLISCKLKRHNYLSLSFKHGAGGWGVWREERNISTCLYLLHGIGCSCSYNWLTLVKCASNWIAGGSKTLTNERIKETQLPNQLLRAYAVLLFQALTRTTGSLLAHKRRQRLTQSQDTGRSALRTASQTPLASAARGLFGER